MLAWLLTSHTARRITLVTLAVYACAAAFAGVVMIILGVSLEPISWLNALSFPFVVSIFPGFFTAIAWAQGRATSNRQQPQTWWWPSRAGRAEEFPLYFFGKSMPTGLQLLAITLFAAVGVSALLVFTSTNLSVGAAPLAAHTPPTMCGYRFSNHGTALCLTAAQGAAAQATFPVIALAFDLVICTICAGGLLEQRSWLNHGTLTPHPSGI